ncbi:hypothetical protein BTA51_23840 [Hahella sp. CCB-MM4]|uniref:lecithin retinol acyltransferase family protein n=1 Tax=Hahella sp. (strain CCB-MM4) TaxID=1926491 RepID=UPI000B9A288D|nr:hypothetical protein BTA51_23840 [Hahella sp. CCB-MM4]
MVGIVIVYMGLYQHWALVSDRQHSGKPMLISNTRRNGTVREEPWDTVVGNRPYKVFPAMTHEPVHTIVARARKAIGSVRYDLLDYNCEHFVKEVVTGVAKSSQSSMLKVLAGLAAIGGIYIVTRNRWVA